MGSTDTSLFPGIGKTVISDMPFWGNTQNTHKKTLVTTPTSGEGDEHAWGTHFLTARSFNGRVYLLSFKVTF